MTLVFAFCHLCLFIGCCCGLYRLVAGPTTLGRILAFDYICAAIIGVVALHSIQNHTGRYLELIIIFSLLGFATVVGFMEAFFFRLKDNNNG